jgi:hypothetical protein
MFTEDQLQDFIGPLIVSMCIGMFAVGVTLFTLFLLERRKAGPHRRVSQHRKGARLHKPTYIPIRVETHPYEPIAFLHAHVRRSTPRLPVTEILPKIEVENATIRPALVRGPRR